MACIILFYSIFILLLAAYMLLGGVLIYVRLQM
jgi:hypothetical protein